MMNPDKNKIATKHVSDESDSLRHQRSSLAVNLSCWSSLTDSGNGSLKQTNVECNDKLPSPAIVSNTTQRSRRCRSFRDRQVSVNNTSGVAHQNVSLKHASVVLKRIENDAESLDKSCEILKQVILTKTKQMFDRQNELSVKTQAILTKNFNQRIDSTPKDKHRSKNVGKQRKQCTLNKRRLFDSKEHLQNTNKKSITLDNNSASDQIRLNNKVHSNITVPNESNRMADISNSASSLPVETEHNKTNYSVTSKNKCPSKLNVSEDDSIFMAEPIGCSTMIQDETLDENPETHHDINDLSIHSKTKKDAISMEITRIQQECVLNNEKNSLVAKGSSKTQDNIQNSSSEEHCTRTLQSSLAVNTSINRSSKDNRNIDICERKESAVENSNKNLKNRQERGIYSTILEGAKQSINTISTSLQMNTSLDGSNKLYSRENNITRRMLKLNSTINKDRDMEEKVDSTNTVEMENTKLIKPQGTKNDTTYRDHQSNVSKNKIISDEDQNGRSYVEATPYPTSRLVLLKSQLNQNVVCSNLSNNNENAIEINSTSNKLSSMEQSTFKERRKSYENGKSRSESIILDNSSSHSCTELPKSIIIRESTDESELKIQDLKNSTMISLKKRNKKKLLPLHESSQLPTFSPVENVNVLPQILRNKHKKRKEKQHVNKLNAICKRRSVEYSDERSNEQFALENDNPVACDAKIQKRKPRKVIRKKIIVKKITTSDDILRRLQESRDNCIKTQTCVSNRNSLNDFQSLKKQSSTQLRNKKAQRISIVMTGLCNDDKNIVKSVVKALGHAKIESSVTKRTTHVVTTGVRTINMLHGIIRGCWLVSLEWVLKSLEKSAWLNPEEYELTHFSKAVLENRKDRQLFGTSYVPELFAACGNLYIGKCTTPPHNVLKDLIKTAGGHTTERPETAKIVIDTNGLKESWVLDCITTGELQPFDQYQRS
ncbi:microcephalin [Halictus rubicundus]|uniref:microcephalin n=1 Tax=Halictus rubicundus TaxID=77578 RepID=UPI00403528BB